MSAARRTAAGRGALVLALWLAVGVLPVGAARPGDPVAMAAARGMSPEEAVAAAHAAGVPSGEAAARLRARGVPEEQIRELLGIAPSRGEVDSTAAANDEDVVEDRIYQTPEEVTESPRPEDEELVPFGYRLFETSPDRYRQPAYGPVDPEYPLGPGDEVVLDVWGDAVFRVERTLDREGGINLPDVGRLVLSGMTVAEAEVVLRRRMGRVYSGLTEDPARATTHLSVTLGDLRMIRVFVVGRARRPGAYDLSASSTVFHAMFFAGGPTESGTMRDVRVIRGGKEVATLDVYDYLRTGRRDGDIRLENDDTIFIPPTGPRVAVKGEVREPGIYELEPGESLEQLVDTAGGFTERAFPGRIQVERILDPDQGADRGADREVLDFARNGEGWSEPLVDGDLVSVFEVADRLRNFVTVHGEVRRPGVYELREGAKLSDLVREAGGLLETAFLSRAGLVRTYEDERREQISVDLGQVMGRGEGHDLRLSPRDQLWVYSIWSLRDKYEVKVFGAVRSPGSYELREKMTLRDLLLQAGGLLESAYDLEVEISRVSPENGEGVGTAEIFRVPLGQDYLTTTDGSFRLEAWDNVFVREIPNYELQRNVRVGGEVEFPGVYTLRGPQETLARVIERAGGLKETAYPEGFALWRTKDDVGRVALDLRRALEDQRSNDNVILFDGDSLFVPEEPKTVTVRGEVGYPTSLVFEKGRSVGDYVARAGGPTQKADRGQTRVIYTTGAAARVKKYWIDPEVLPGSTIVVPRKEEGEGVDWGGVIKDSTSILASLATVALIVDRVGQ